MSPTLATIIERLQAGGGLKVEDIAPILAVSLATMSRWSSDEADPHPPARHILHDLSDGVDRLAEFYTAPEVRLRLHAAHPMLGGERAIDLIRVERTEEVVAVIDGIETGAYA